jgi:hypothetical protein
MEVAHRGPGITPFDIAMSHRLKQKAGILIHRHDLIKLAICSVQVYIWTTIAEQKWFARNLNQNESNDRHIFLSVQHWANLVSSPDPLGDERK